MPLREDLLAPVPGENPAGVSLRYEPIFEAIKEARREEEDLPRGDWEEERKTADFAKVVKLAGEALACESKDLQLAAWLVEAQLHLEGFAGLAGGVALCSGLIEGFWDSMYPDVHDLEFRSSPLNWIGGYLTVAVRSTPIDSGGNSYLRYLEAGSVPSEADAVDEEKQAQRQAAIEAGKVTPESLDRAFADTDKAWFKGLASQVDSCIRELARLKTISRARFAEAEPNFLPLQEALSDVDRLVSKLLKRKLELDPDPVEESTMDIDHGADAGDGENASLTPVNERDAESRIAAAAHFLQKREPTNPSSYLMLRGFRWGELRAGNGSIDPRLLAAPPTPVRTRLKTLLLDESWSELLEEGERVMAAPYGRGWLDLQRYTLTACYRLGSEYDSVAAAIHNSLAAMLRDFPGLPGLTLMDDGPTANEETRSWLKEAFFDGASREESEGAAPIVPPDSSPPGDASRAGAYDRALKEVRSGAPRKGIELLMRELEREKSERARFLRRSELADIMVDSGFESVALPILHELQEAIERHRLDVWERPDVVARPLGLLYRCIDALGGVSDEAKRTLYQRVCQLDPVRAMALNGDAGPLGPEAETDPTASAPPLSDLAEPEAEDDDILA